MAKVLIHNITKLHRVIKDTPMAQLPMHENTYLALLNHLSLVGSAIMFCKMTDV